MEEKINQPDTERFDRNITDIQQNISLEEIRNCKVNHHSYNVNICIEMKYIFNLSL